MDTRRKIILAAAFAGCCHLLCAAAATAATGLIADGLTMAGVAGKVTAEEDRWFFEPVSELADERGRVFAGRRLELLPCVQLEKIEDDLKKRGLAYYKIWGRVTRYRDENRVFVFYFLPLSEIKETVPDSRQTSQNVCEPTILVNEPNDPLVIPQHIVRRLSKVRHARSDSIPPAEGETTLTWQGQRQRPFAADSIIADKTGFLARSTDGRCEFSFDAVGRRSSDDKIELLACATLERAEQTQKAEAEPVRFKIAGIVTRYKGRKYLLLQKATRLYDYGNFGR